MDILLQLRALHFSADALPLGSDAQQHKALQMKCFLAAAGITESDPTHEAADAMLNAGAPARRERLWASFTHAAGVERDFCIPAGALAELDVSTAMLKASAMADLAEGTVAARDASIKAHTALLDYHSHQQQVAAQRAAAAAAAAAAAVATAAATSNAGNGSQPGFAPAGGVRPPGPQGPGRPGFRPPAQPGQPLLGQPHPTQQPGAPGPGPGFASHLGPEGGGARGPSAWQSGSASMPPGGAACSQAGAGLSRWAHGKRGAPDALSPPDDTDGGGAGGGGFGASGGGLGGFRTAKSQLVADCARKGQPPPSFVNQAPRTGLMRPQKAQKTGPGGGSSSVRGFVPPFVAKAVDGMNGGGGNGAGGGAGGEGGVESPYPAKLLDMLSERGLLSFDAEGGLVLPQKLAQLDPKIIEHVFNEVTDCSGGITWDDIAGQEAAKRLVQEMVVWPMLNPQLFTGARAPPRGLLLFGPPGTGKTLIGKAVAANICATFFSISASSLTSKWIGEGERMVRALFALAGLLSPSVIFIDEIDSLISARKSEGEHEASRRLKTQMLIELEGCDPSKDAERILLIGATNRPEELDEAARRRMPKQLYIPLPCEAARRQMLMRAFRAGSDILHSLTPADLDKVVERTAGYSGSDMKNLIQEACQGPVRDLFRQRGNVTNVAPSELRPVTLRDFQMACKAQKRTVADCEIERYIAYDASFGAKYVGDDPAAEGEEELEPW